MLRGVQPLGPMFASAVEAAARAGAFHWPLEFPDVMARGGFDAVLGNPPWERMKLEEREFFASRDQDVAKAPNAAARSRLIAKLKDAAPDTRERALFEAFELTKRTAEASSIFARVPKEDGGRFPLTGRGDVNTYALFAELFASLASRRGRAGIIVPTGIATSDTTKHFFEDLVSTGRLVSFFNFYEIRQWFVATDDRNPFGLLTLGFDQTAAQFAFSLKGIDELADIERRFTLSPEDIARISPNTKTAPIFRSRVDAELTAKIYSRAQILINDNSDRDYSGWGAHYLRLIHFGDHKNELVTAEQAQERGFRREGAFWNKGEERLLPVWESKLTNAYDLHYATFTNGEDVQLITEGNKTSEGQLFRYWISQAFFNSIMFKYDHGKNWFLAYRDVARSTDERSVIALGIPREPASIKLPVLGLRNAAPGHLLLANLNSIPLDYIARQKLGGISLSFFILKQLPVVPVTSYTDFDKSWISRRVLELTYTSHSMALFARDLGYEGPPFAWDENHRAQLRADLDAWYARAYGLTRDELRYILDPADVRGSDYPSETFRVLKEKETRQYGEYRTRRLVLEAWDRMEIGGTLAKPKLTAGQVQNTPVALAELPDGGWAWATRPQDVGAALTAILKAIGGPTASRVIRLATTIIMEPRLLTPLLTSSRLQEWRRLVGDEAESRAANVIRFSPRTNQHWGTAVANHRGNGRLVEDIRAGTWAPGPGLEAFDTAGWPDGRARFVLEALALLDLDKTVTSMPDKVRGWITDVATA